MPGAPTLASGSGGPLSAAHDVALLDLDGVVYVGPDAVPGVPEALSDVRSAGMRLGFVTNNAARTPEQVAEHLTELGVDAEPEDVITSSQAAATVVAELLGPGARVLPVGGPGVATALRAAGLTVVDRAEDHPDAVVQGYGREVGWAQLAEAVVAVRNGARHVATNTDATIPSPRGPLPGNGAMVGVVSAVTGRQPLVTGKPDPAMHAECVRRTGARRPLVVGDRLDTDIEGARAGRGGQPARVHRRHRSRARCSLPRPDTAPTAGAGRGAGCWRPPAGEHGDGGRRCGGWDGAGGGGGGAVLVHRGGAGTGGGRSDGLDGLRALCVAHWAATRRRARPAASCAGDAPAGTALGSWGRGRLRRRSEQLAQAQQVPQSGLQLHRPGGPRLAEGSWPTVRAIRSSLVIVSRMSAFGMPCRRDRLHVPHGTCAQPPEDHLVQVGQPAGQRAVQARGRLGWAAMSPRMPFRAVMHSSIVATRAALRRHTNPSNRPPGR